MHRFTLFGLLATFFTLIAAIPTPTKLTPSSIEKRAKSISSYNKYAGPKPKKYKKKKNHGYPPGYSPPTPSNPACPSDPFYIQASLNNNYAVITPILVVAADAFQLSFDASTQELAVR